MLLINFYIYILNKHKIDNFRGKLTFLIFCAVYGAHVFNTGLEGMAEDSEASDFRLETF